jgi:hypothetical protein
MDMKNILELPNSSNNTTNGKISEHSEPIIVEIDPSKPGEGIDVIGFKRLEPEPKLSDEAKFESESVPKVDMEDVEENNNKTGGEAEAEAEASEVKRRKRGRPPGSNNKGVGRMPKPGVDSNGKRLRKGFALVEVDSEDAKPKDEVNLDMTLDESLLYQVRKPRTNRTQVRYFEGDEEGAPPKPPLVKKKKNEPVLTKENLLHGVKVRKWHHRLCLVGDVKVMKWVPEEKDGHERLQDFRPTKKEKYKRRSRSQYSIVENLNATAMVEVLDR